MITCLSEETTKHCKVASFACFIIITYSDAEEKLKCKSIKIYWDQKSANLTINRNTVIYMNL